MPKSKAHFNEVMKQLFCRISLRRSLRAILSISSAELPDFMVAVARRFQIFEEIQLHPHIQTGAFPFKLRPLHIRL